MHRTSVHHSQHVHLLGCISQHHQEHPTGRTIYPHAKKKDLGGRPRLVNVFEYRARFLRMIVALRFLNRENAPTQAKLALPEVLDTARAEVLAKTIVLLHDETTFQANDYARTQRGTKDDHRLVPKSRGAGIMISDFISEEGGYLCQTDVAGHDKYPQLKQFARESIAYGGNHWWLLDIQELPRAA